MATGVALDAGLTRLALLGIAGGGTGYDNGNARVIVGDDDTAPAATDTGIIGTAVADAMDATFPTSPPVDNTLVFQATYAAAAITNAIKEVCVDNGAAAAEALCRIVLDATEQVTPGIADIIRVTVRIPLA
jgi:hypothetical protein